MTTSESTDGPRGGALRNALGVAIVVIAIAAVAVGFLREADRAREAEEIAAAPSTPASNVSPDSSAMRLEPVIVYYFHGDHRCETCLAIEAQTTQVIEKQFAGAVDAGRLRLDVVNFDAPANRHFRDDYELAFGGVLVQGAGPEREWEILDDVWDLIHDDPADFEKYLVDHIQPMLDRAG